MNWLLRLFILFLLFINFSNAVRAEKFPLRLAYGRLSLIDLGSFLTIDPLIQNEKLIRTYPLSGFSDETRKSIVAIQAIKDAGKTDLNLSTEQGLRQFEIKIEYENSAEDLILDPQKSKSKILEKLFHMEKSKSILIKSPYPINEFVLGGNPELISLEKIHPRAHPKYLYEFLIYSKNLTGTTDLVIASTKTVYKLTLEISEKTEEPIYEIQLPL
jgi:hypothetical protein